MVAVIKADSKSFDPEGKDDVYIKARFDHIREGFDPKETSSTTTSPRVDKLDEALRNKSETRVEDSYAIREKKMRADELAWTKPLGKHSNSN